MVSEDLALIGAVARVVRTILVVDMVESVRLIEQDEEETITRWRNFVSHVVALVLPPHEGRLVKSLGDGMMIEFPRVLNAIHAAFEIQRISLEANRDLPPERRMLMRIGANISTVIADTHDVYGHGVNLAARLTTLANPGEIVVSADVRDLLTPMLDADIEDLGECFLKHVSRPVRAYRIAPPGEHSTLDLPAVSPHDVLPTIAVLPLRARSTEAHHDLVGEVLADEIIGALSRTAQMHVISRLSTTAFHGRNATLEEITKALRPDYVMTGGFRVAGQRLTLMAQLAEARNGHVVWSGDLKGNVARLLNGEDALIERVVAEVSSAMTAHAITRAQSQPLSSLEGYALLFGAVALMHRLSHQDFNRARTLLQTLIDRLPRQAVPYAWLGKWHVLRAQQGWSEDASAEARQALSATARALDLDSNCSLALVMDGFAHANLLRELEIARQRYDAALMLNPNESMAWLLRGTMHAFKGEGKVAVKETQHALKLSPLDPLRYFYDSLAATAALSAGKDGQAVELAKRSLRANRTHASTLRVLIVGLWNLKQEEEARRVVTELLRIDPNFTVTRFLAHSPAGSSEFGRTAAKVFLAAGVPH